VDEGGGVDAEPNASVFPHRFLTVHSVQTHRFEP